MRRACVRMMLSSVLGLAASACVYAGRYDAVAPTREALANGGDGVSFCVAGKGVVRMLGQKISDAEVCGAAFVPGGAGYVQQCFARETITRAFAERVVMASAFEPLQGPVCEG